MTLQRPAPEPGYPPASVVLGEWDDPTDPMDLLTGAAAVGSRAWEEQQLHRVVGSWTHDATDPAMVTAFDRISMRHAWRAEVLIARLPQLRELPLQRIVVPVAGGPDLEWERSLARAPDVDRRTAWSDLAEVRISGYRGLLGRTTPVADAPLRRWMPLLIDSLVEDVATLDALGHL